MTVDRFIVGVVRNFELSQREFLSDELAPSRGSTIERSWQRITTGRIHTRDHASREQRSALFTRPLIASKHALRITRLRNRPQDRQLTDARLDGRMKERNRTDAAHAARRNHVDACRLRIRLSELFRVVHPPLTRSVYMSTHAR